MSFCCWGSVRRRPQPGLGPGVGAQLASQCRAAMAGKAGKELCATMERRGRPEVGRALQWCSPEPVSQWTANLELDAVGSVFGLLRRLLMFGIQGRLYPLLP